MSDRLKKEKIDIVNPKALRIGIVRSLYNQDITDQQLARATECLEEHGVAYDVIDVTGTFEIAYMLQRMAESKKYNGLVALGCLIKGETSHYDIIANAIGEAVMNLIREYKLPIGFGIITAFEKDQAIARDWLGHDAAYAVLHSLNQLQK
ncbi:MAG: 6,7-dimethyl-8-ribityllumazine synthase [Candidatus Kerfeldbacteria bacterium]|nr:6,7-dimethyl-8-ribityllumazine synthase [Bacteroidota bacterium]